MTLNFKYGHFQDYMEIWIDMDKYRTIYGLTPYNRFFLNRK